MFCSISSYSNWFIWSRQTSQPANVGNSFTLILGLSSILTDACCQVSFDSLYHGSPGHMQHSGLILSTTDFCFRRRRSSGKCSMSFNFSGLILLNGFVSPANDHISAVITRRYLCTKPSLSTELTVARSYMCADRLGVRLCACLRVCAGPCSASSVNGNVAGRAYVDIYILYIYKYVNVCMLACGASATPLEMCMGQ